MKIANRYMLSLYSLKLRMVMFTYVNMRTNRSYWSRIKEFDDDE